MNTTTKSSTPFATELPEFKKNILAALSTNSGKNLPRVFDFSDFGYVIRHAQLSDLPILSKIESQCWSKGLQSSKKQLKQRLTNYPQGQFVLQLTHNKQSLVGVIYSQRVDSIAKIKSASAKNVSSLHVDQGAHLQLLAVNILPEEQHRNLGDQLLEFVLQYASVKEDLESVVAVTLCKSFHRQNTLPMEAYIHQCDQYNRLQDPILRFHQRHGASITCPVEGYRAEDKNNDGYGVLVQYNPHQRITQRLSAPTQQQKPTLSFTTIGDFMALAISPFLNEQRDYAIDRPFIEMGLDSLDLSMLAEKISSEYDFSTDALFFLRHTTPHKVINFMLQPTDAAQEASSAAPVASDRQTKQSRGDSKRIDIAIIGQSCRLPTNINDPQSFWALLQAGESAVTSLPNDRWQWPNEIDVTTAHKGIEQGAFFDSVKYFDAEFFRISTPEAQSMDPQQRILMELAWHTLENAGQKAQTLAGSATGVFIGASGSDYTRAMDYATTAIEAHSSTGCSVASLANRISYFFDFHGPSLVIDTACSSSLFAIHQAVAAIQNQECQQALAGGVNIICHPANSIAYYKAGMLAPDGQCKTFDSQANGYVRGEGAVLFLLKTLTQAQQNGDHILALIKGSACNHQGQAAGLTVPNSKQQAELLRQAWHNAGVDPQSISYIEAHGTGTHLGDPVEFEGIQQAFNTHPTEHQVCGIGSVKTNIGHLEASAGAAGLLKVIMSLQHQALPSTKHFRRINPKIDTDNSSLFIVDKYQHWTPSVGYPRRAGLSSFGSGGANAHIVVEEYNQHASSIALEKHLVDGPYLFILSAANPTRLTEYTQNYLDHCLSLAKTNDANTLLGPMTYYLRHHRQALHSRLAIVANELNDLIEQLKTLVGLTDHEQRASEPTISLTIQDDVQKALADKDMTALASHWLSGASIDWSTLEAKMVVDLKVMRTLCCIPNYPFAKNAYWFEPTKDTPEHSAVVNPAPSVPNQPHQAPQDVLYTLKLVWQTINEPASIPAQPASKSAVIIGGTEQQQSRVQRYFPNSSLVTQHPDTSTEQLIEQLAALKSVEHIVWMTEQQSEEPMDLADVLPCQHSTLLALFRLFKAADSLFDDAIPLHWTVITEQSHSMYSDQPLQLSYAGLHGFVGSLAKERPQWKMRLLDIEQHQQWPSINETTPGFSDDAKPMAWREGCWHRPALVPIEVDFNKAQSAYRHGGVYVVIGGAGGLGVAWSEYLIKNYQAQIIWIGRRELDETIQLQLDRLSHPQSPSPRYLSADAADLTALQQVYQQIKTDFVQIHGVIHAAVGQFDAAFKHTDEAYFKTTLNAKIDVSVRIGQVFEQHDLDFVLFFSSVESFWRSGGYSGYSAGCSFIDQFAERLSKRTHCPVKVIHWGHWATGAGQHISKATKERLRNSGFRLLQGPESMAALECLLQNDGINQLALIKSENAQILPWYSPNEHLQYSKPQSSSSTFEIPDLEEVTAHVVEQMMSAGVFQHQQMTRLLQQLLQQHIGEYCVDAKASTFYRRWLTATQHIVAAIDFKDPQNQSTWELWHHFKNELQDESLKNAAQIVENCLLSLPDILSGEKQAMDILFPGGSLDNVEKLYRHNPVADYFNQALATLLLGAIKTHGDSKTPCKIRILEIGAGTGATTRTLLGHLSAHESRIEEYRFTEISSSFLLQ
ncbi:MAG: acyl transferase domain-containing protein, partial [Phenylobacterium sp.]